MQTQLKAFLVLLICATCTADLSSTAAETCQDCDTASGVSEQALLQSTRVGLFKARSEDEAEEGEEEEDETDMPETDAPEAGGEESGAGGGHWDFLDEEHNDEPLQQPEEGEHLGGIKGVVSDVVSELIAPLESQVQDVSSKVETMHDEMVAHHEDDDTVAQVNAALQPLRSKLESIEGKVDTAQENHAAVADSIQNVADDLSKLDDISAAVGNAATADDVRQTQDTITASVDAHEQNVAGALGSIYSKARDNGKVINKIYNDVHYGAAPAPAR